MLVESISRSESDCFSKQQIQLAENQDQLVNFINRPFELGNFHAQMEDKKAAFTNGQRELLVRGLEEQYHGIKCNDKVSNALKSLSNENTFTVCTGHQLSLLTGPIYFIYKILHVIKLCEALKVSFPNADFVPVFWMASEDHDFDEVKETAVFNQVLRWDSTHKGAVGRFSTSGLQDVKNKLKSIFGNSRTNEVIDLLDAYSGPRYGQAFFRFIHTLFSNFGLVVVDGDNVVFKAAFAAIIEKELVEQFSFQAVQQASLALNDLGLKTQANPREINLFYLSPNRRERIQKKGEDYLIGEYTFTAAEIMKKLRENPADFSPNVILRPVYQEFILPNICYVGGLGELNYWLQLKGVFEKANVLYPLIQARSSLIYIDHTLANKIASLGLTWRDFFADSHTISKEFIKRQDTSALDFSAVDKLFDSLKEQVSTLISDHEAPLASAVGADLSKMQNALQSIKDKSWRAEKLKHEKSIKVIEQIKEKLFPNGNMQERSMNFFQICPEGNVSEKLQDIYMAISPTNSNINIVIETK
jgi:bacillithiol synthase